MKTGASGANTTPCPYMEKDQIRRYYQSMHGPGNAIADRERIAADLEKQVARLGFQWFMYWRMRPAYGPRTPLYITNYPARWLKRHQERGYGSFEPVGHRASQTKQAFLWSDLRKMPHLTQRQKTVFVEAARFGLRAGGTIPLHGPGATRALLCVAADCSEATFAKRFTEQLGTLQQLAMLTHQAMAETTIPRPLDPNLKITPHEAEALTFAARGFTRKNIARQMAIHDETVKDHLDRCRRKLGARNIAHAVAIAMWHGVILP